MAGRIRDEDVAAVRERANIVDVVGEHLQLRPAGGGSWKGLCPFHDEKSPSFQVTPSRNLYYCFGCQAGGDVIGFVMKVDHLSFTEAVERLAVKAGVQLRYEEGGASVQRDRGTRARLVEASAAAAAFYADRLNSPEAETGRRFLSERGFDSGVAEHFGVGYALREWDALTKHLHGRGFTDDELVTGGLSIRGQRGLYDRFRGRLVWPIRDVTGDTIGFGARKLFDNDDGPKYLNTPETTVYKKSTALYGIDLAKREIAKQQQAVVVEGYTDVMACHLSGVETAVATCGTAFGGDHVKVLRRLLLDDGLNGEVVFTFDGDAAGQKAAVRSFEQDQKFAAQTFVAVEPSGLDPCELRQTKGEDAVRALIATRRPLLQFVVEASIRDHDLDRPEGRVAALRAAAPIVAAVKDRTLRPEYVRALSGWVGMEFDLVQQAVVEAERAPRERHASVRAEPVTSTAEVPGAAIAVPRPDPRDRRLIVERETLKLVLQAPRLAAAAGVDSIGSAAFLHPAYVGLAVAVGDAGGATAGASATSAGWVQSVSEATTDVTVRALVTELAVEALLSPGDPDERYAEEYVARMRGRLVAQEIAEAKSRLQRVDPADADASAQLLGELVRLEQERRKLLERTVGSG